MDYAIEFVNRLKIVLSFLKKNKGKYSSQIEIIEELESFQTNMNLKAEKTLG